MTIIETTLKASCALLVSVAALTLAALADTPDDGKGRFTMSPVEGGFLRLDKDTGAVAMCARTNNTWVCEPVEDRTVQQDAGKSAKLETENKDLKDKIKSLEEALGNKPLPNGEPPPGGKMQLPTEEEVDQALDYVERIFKKFRDRVQKLEKPPGPQDGATPDSGPSKAL